jgi:hypothetical protein
MNPKKVVNPNKELWEKGDFTRIARSMRDSGRALVEGLGITPGLQVLDLGCGDGTTALPAAELGASVLGVDIASNLVAAGQVRARELGRPGGRIVMGNWIPGDPTLVAQLLQISSAYTPSPPAGFVSPMTWGIEDNVIERFAAAGIAGDRISFERATYTFDYPGPPSEFLAQFRAFYGPTINAYQAAAADGREAELHGELVTLFQKHNVTAAEGTTSIPARYLRVTVTR